MKIIFRDKKLEFVANDTKKLRKKYWDQFEKIYSLLNTLSAADNFSAIPLWLWIRPHQLTQQKASRIFYSLDLKHPYRMVVSPVWDFHDEQWKNEADTLEIIELYVNTHDKFNIHKYC